MGLLIFVLLPRIGPTRVLTLEWVVLSTFALVAIARRFEAVRLGARPLGIGLALASGVALTVALSTASERVEIVRHVLNVFEVETILAIVTWTAFYALALISGVLGLRAVRRVSGDASRRARRVAWTARATLAMSAIGALVIGFPVWALIYRAFRWALPEGALHHSLTQAFGARTMPTDRLHRAHLRGNRRTWSCPGCSLPPRSSRAFSRLAVILVGVDRARARPRSTAASVAATPMKPKEKRQQRYRDEATASRRLGVWLSTGLWIVMWGVNLLFVVMIAAGVVNVWHWMASIGRESGRQLDELVPHVLRDVGQAARSSSAARGSRRRRSVSRPFAGDSRARCSVCIRCSTRRSTSTIISGSIRAPARPARRSPSGTRRSCATCTNGVIVHRHIRLRRHRHRRAQPRHRDHRGLSRLPPA